MSLSPVASNVAAKKGERKTWLRRTQVDKAPVPRLGSNHVCVHYSGCLWRNAHSHARPARRQPSRPRRPTRPPRLQPRPPRPPLPQQPTRPLPPPQLPLPPTAAAAAATGTPAAKAVTGGKVIIAQWNPPDNLQALNAKSSYALFPVDIIFGTLLRVNEKLEFLPRIASKWTISPDKTVYTFTIDPKAKWHDGTPVTADDVEFTIWAITDPAIETNRGSFVASIKGLTNAKRPAGVNTVSGVKVIDPQTIEFTLTTATDPQYFLEAMGQNVYLIPKAQLKDVAAGRFRQVTLLAQADRRRALQVLAVPDRPVPRAEALRRLRARQA